MPSRASRKEMLSPFGLLVAAFSSVPGPPSRLLLDAPRCTRRAATETLMPREGEFLAIPHPWPVDSTWAFFPFGLHPCARLGPSLDFRTFDSTPLDLLAKVGCSSYSLSGSGLGLPWTRPRHVPLLTICELEDRATTQIIPDRTARAETRSASLRSGYEVSSAPPWKCCFSYEEVKTIALTLVKHGQFLFRSGAVYNRYSETINAMSAARPGIRQSPGPAWDLASAWLSEEPHVHHSHRALFKAVLLAILASALM